MNKFNYSILRYYIIEKYGTISEFCRKFGYNQANMSSVFSVKTNRNFTLNQFIRIVNDLELTEHEVYRIFFTK